MIRHPDSVFSTVLPHPRANHAFAVRTIYPNPIPFGTLGLDSEPVGRDELVVINGETLEVESIWAPESRLVLMGRVGGRAVLLVYDGTDARVVAFDLESRQITRSEPVEVSNDQFCFRPDHLYFCARSISFDAAHEVAPLGAESFALTCSNGRSCTVTVTDEGLQITQGGDVAPQDSRRGLSVDGETVTGVAVRTRGCLVRSELRLPPIPEAETSAECRLITLSPPEGQDPYEAADESDAFEEGLPYFQEVLASGGCTLSMGYQEMSFDDDGDESLVEYGFALPPESFEIGVDQERGMYLLRLPAPRAGFGLSGGCFQGELWLRLQSSSAPPSSEPRTLEWEYGYCE